MLKYTLSLLFLLFSVNAENSSSTTTSRWDGWKFNFNAGIFAVLQKITPIDQKRIGPSFEAGVEYGHTFGSNNQFYAGGNILFNAYIPDSFKLNRLTLVGGESEVYPIFFPMFDVMLGYTFNQDSQVLIGSTYFWGLTAGYRTAISDTMYVSFKAIWWVDRVLFKLGLHDFSATMGIGYHF